MKRIHIRIRKRHVIVAAAIVVAGLAVHGIRSNRSTFTSPQPSMQATPSTSMLTCDQSLWNHVYHPQRLQKVEDCKTVTGTIDFVRKEADGDFHIGLKPDDTSVVNSCNSTCMGGAEHGDLILEPVCQNPVTQSDAISACQGFTGTVFIPKVGDHVEAMGSYVLDTQHGGWAELHPVSSIVIK